ncbi:MAG: sulfatase-like hydrolase/transferase [Synergistaceae bacterium]|nr:sulfatase-like hydrolase/transferase [Synergistaceae bacterium]
MASLQAFVIYLFLKKFTFIHDTLKYIFLCVSFCVFAMDLFAVYHYDLTFNNIMFEIIMMTNLREGGEFLQTYLADGKFWMFIAGILCALAVLRGIYGLFMKMQRVAVILFLVVFAASAVTTLRDAIIHFESFPDFIINTNALSRIYQMYMKNYRAEKDYQKILAGACLEVPITKNNSSIPYVVFILGESTDRNRISLYGYSLLTSPKLSQREGLYVFSDVVSPHSHTNAVLQKLFTFCRYGSKSKWYMYTSLFSILKSAGYFTVWMSNQEGPAAGNCVRLYAGQCGQSIFTENLRDTWDNAFCYDEQLLPKLEEVISSEHHAKNFYVLHLIGTHGNYRKRFPPELAKFTAKDEGGFSGLTESQKEERAHYDNAVLYNDFVVDEIIRRFEDKNAILIYVSDHGEDVYDSSTILLGHNEGTPSRFMIEIPMIIWVSDIFSKTYPELEARIAQSVNRPYMTDDMIHTILDIMSIETQDFDPAKSIINPSFDITRPRIYSNHVYTKEDGLAPLP